MPTIRENIQKTFTKVNESLPNYYNTYKYPIQTSMFIIIIALFIGLTLHFLKSKNVQFLQSYTKYIMYGLGIAGFLSVLILLNQINNQGTQSTQKNIYGQLIFFIKYLFLLGLGVGVLVAVIYGLTSGSTISILTLNILLFAAIILGLYLIHKLISQTTLYKEIVSSKFFSTLYYGIFMIPTILIDGGTSLFQNVKNTSPSYFYLLLIEILLITLYFVVPYLYKTLVRHNMKILLDKPIYINSSKTLGTFEDLKPSAKDDYKYQYGVGFKFFIDQNLPNSSNAAIRDTVIFNYGNKPKVTFNVKEGLLKVTCREGVDGNVIVYKTKNIPRQRWNTMVINYKNGIMDIFINNDLVASKNNLVPYMTHDAITSGSDNGINGGIKEVYYSNEPFNLSKIKMM